MLRGPQSLLAELRNPRHYPHSKENSWGMSLILVCLLHPLEQASCYCQRQTLCQYFFCLESRHIYSARCSAHLNSHITSCSFHFFSSSLHLSVILCSDIAHWSHIQPLMWAQTLSHTHTRAWLYLFVSYFLFFSHLVLCGNVPEPSEITLEALSSLCNFQTIWLRHCTFRPASSSRHHFTNISWISGSL